MRTALVYFCSNNSRIYYPRRNMVNKSDYQSSDAKTSMWSTHVEYKIKLKSFKAYQFSRFATNPSNIFIKLPTNYIAY